MIPLSPKQRAIHTLQLQAIARPYKVQESQPIVVLLILRGHDDAVHAALQPPVRQHGHDIGDIHRQRAGTDGEVFPFRVIVFLDLEGGDGLLEHEGDGAIVGMSPGVEMLVFLVLFGCAGPVTHVAETAVAFCLIAMSVHKLVFWEFQDDCKQPEEFISNMLVAVAVELLDFFPVASHYVWMGPIVLGEEFHDIVKFDIVAKSGQDLNRTQRSVAIVDTLF